LRWAVPEEIENAKSRYGEEPSLTSRIVSDMNLGDRLFLFVVLQAVIIALMIAPYYVAIDPEDAGAWQQVADVPSGDLALPRVQP
jgi:hypothetical protein